MDEHAQIHTERFWKKFKRILGKVPFAKDLAVLYFCLMDIKTPLPVKATIGAAIAYVMLPTDLVADILPAVGFSDDAAVIAATLVTVAAHITEEHRQKAEEVFN